MTDITDDKLREIKAFRAALTEYGDARVRAERERIAQRLRSEANFIRSTGQPVSAVNVLNEFACTLTTKGRDDGK